MGWNDHVEFRDMECSRCGVIDVWEFWDKVAVWRYSGGLDKLLGHDAANNGRCPHCGATTGREVDDDD